MLHAGIADVRQPTIISRGSLIVRLLNLGRESANKDASPNIKAFDDANKRPNKKRVRARPAWDVAGGPIARELAGKERTAAH